MRLGLIGLGRIGTFHAETITALPTVDSLVVADTEQLAVDRIVDRFGAEAAGTPDSLLQARLDGLVIATPTDAHAAMIETAVEAGLPVFCEKPVCRTPSEAVRLLRRIEDSGVQVQIGYHRRFDSGFVAARHAVLSGELGWLHTIRSATMDPAPPSPAYVATSGGIFRDCGVHDFDIIRFVTGREVVEVYATGSARGDGVFAETGDLATSAAILTLDDGTMSVVSNTRYNARGYDVRLELHGSRDSIAVGLEDRLPLRSVEPGAKFPGGDPHRLFLNRFAAAYRAELATFVDVIAGRRVSPCTVADAVEAGWIAEACALSRRRRRPVRIGEIRRRDSPFADAPFPEGARK